MAWPCSVRLDGEHWLPVPGYPEYEVSNLGNVRRLPGVDSIGRRSAGGLISQHGGGGRLGSYLRVGLCSGGVRKTFNVHVLVAVTWLGDHRVDSLTVDHVDGNTERNAVANLRWATGLENFTNGAHKRWDSTPRYSPPGEV